MKVRRAGGVLVVAVLAVGACGGESVSAAQRLVLGAAQRTFAANTAQVAFVIEGLDEDVTGEGQIDFAAGQSETVTAGLAEGDTTVLVDGDQSLLRVDGLTPPGRVVNISPDLPDVIDGTAIINQLLVVLQPIQLLQLLNGADDADDLGTEPVDGVDTTHVSATINLADALDSLDGAARRALQQAIDGLDTDTVDVDVFIDGDGRVRRMQLQLTLNDGTVVTTTQNFSDFGEPVDIRIPRERRVLSTEDAAGIVTADISGTWMAVETITESSAEEYFPLGPQAAATFELTCSAAGVCSSDSGPWPADGGGSFSFERTIVGPCTDNATGAVTAEQGAEDAYATTVRVTETDGTQATAMTGESELAARILPDGLAVACLLSSTSVTEAAASSTIEYVRVG